MQTILHDYWRSSASYRARIGLNLLGLPYRSVSVDLLGGGCAVPITSLATLRGLYPPSKLTASY